MASVPVYKHLPVPVDTPSKGYLDQEFFNIERTKPGVFQQPETGSVPRTVNDKLAERMSVADFRKTGDTDDTASFLRMRDAAASKTLARTVAVGDVGAGSYSMPIQWVPENFYRISDEIALGNAFDIRGEINSYIKQTNSSKLIFTSAVTGAGYLWRLQGLSLIGGAQQVVLTRPGSDVGMGALVDMTYSASDPTLMAVSLTQLGGMIDIVRNRITSAAQWLDLITCDDVHIHDSWLNGYDTASQKKPANTCSIRMAGSSDSNMSVTITETRMVPEPGPSASNVDTRWIDFHDYVDLHIHDSQFSGENAGFPGIYNYSSCATVSAYPYVTPTGITITDCQLSCGGSARYDRGVVVLKTAVPHRIVVKHGTQLIDSYVINDQIAGGAAAWLAGITDATHPRISVNVGDITGSGFSVANTTALDTYTQSWLQQVGGPNILTAPAFSVGSALVRSGTGSPETVVTAPIGSLFLRTDGGAGTCLYVKESGVGNTGWIAK